MKLRTFSPSFNGLITEVCALDSSTVDDSELYKRVSALMFDHVGSVRDNKELTGKERRLATNESALIYSFVILNPSKRGSTLYNMFVKLKTKEIIKDIILLKCCITNGLVLFENEELSLLINRI